MARKPAAKTDQARSALRRRETLHATTPQKRTWPPNTVKTRAAPGGRLSKLIPIEKGMNPWAQPAPTKRNAAPRPGSGGKTYWDECSWRQVKLATIGTR